jgi:hypothetical protein
MISTSGLEHDRRDATISPLIQKRSNSGHSSRGAAETERQAHE